MNTKKVYIESSRFLKDASYHYSFTKNTVQHY